MHNNILYNSGNILSPVIMHVKMACSNMCTAEWFGCD